MSGRVVRHTSAFTLAVALAAVWVGSSPSSAQAGDDLAVELASLPAAAEVAPPSMGDVAPADTVSQLTDVLAPVTEAGATATPATAAAAVVAVEVVPEAPESAADAGPAVTTEAAPEPAIPPDTTAGGGDIAPDTPPAVVEPAPVAPAAGTVAPPPQATNVNVSIRIDSPGDNGAVSQLNVSGTTTAVPATPHPTAAAAASPPPTTSSPSPTDAADAPAIAAAPPAADDAANTWYWSWDCLSAPPISAISPAGYPTGSMPLTWTWIWNCDGNSSQYHGETPGRYQQTNTNVSIRIASPGDDGPVTQVNVAIAAAASWIAPPNPSGPTTLPAAPVRALPWIALPAPAPAPAPAAALSAIPATAAVSTELEDAPVLAASPLPAVLAPAPGYLQHRRDTAPMPHAASVGARPAHAGRWTQATRGAVSRQEPTRSWAVEPAPKALSGPGDAGRAAKAPRKGAAPQWRPAAHTPLVPARTSGASASAFGGASSGGGGLPFILALPFVAAVLDLARRVALERATWPPGHRRRVPDTPG